MAEIAPLRLERPGHVDPRTLFLQRGSGLAYNRRGSFGTSRQRGQVTHFPAVTRGELAVQVEFHLWESADGWPDGLAIVPKVAEEIGHGRRAILFRGPQW